MNKTVEDSASIPSIKVFYDGQCPICRREIVHYQGLNGADRIDWIDITESTTILHQHGLNPGQALARFHVLDSQGHWQVGAYGFIEMWRQLPAKRWLAMLTTRLRLVPVADWAYQHFARWRLAKRCQGKTCKS